MSGAATHAAAVRAAEGEADLVSVRALLRDYAAGLEVDLAFQGFAAELAGLPGRYAAPDGGLWLAEAADGTAVGCVGLRPVDREGVCELKRLFVRPAGRGLGLGRALAGTAIAAARARGYREMWLDTLPSMRTAQALYRELGFQPGPVYAEVVMPGHAFMRLALAP